MKFFGFIVFVIIYCRGFAAVMEGKITDLDHPGKCVYEGLILSPGEDGYPKGQCMHVMCSTADGSGTVHTCGSLGTSPPCYLGNYTNPTANYPECCFREVICPENYMERNTKMENVPNKEK
uniref:Single domain-containing protein n=1 Tax=Musca domestica TaxID=7370 RepID=A0A1I8NKQ4_MUSDO